ncbi:hypothetical protein H0H81_004381, partial [Sphagnurus paluster]
DYDAFCATFIHTEGTELSALLQKIDAHGLERLASSLKNDMGCTILALCISSNNRPKISTMMGGMNVHLDILFDDATVWLARIPRTTAVTPPQDIQDHILRSEYATLSWLHRIGFPAPAVYGYGLAAHPNIAGVGYMIMEKLEASPLHWPGLSSDQRYHVLRQLAQLYLTLEHHSFDRAGSIYPEDTVGAFADPIAYEVDDDQIRLLGPFDTLREHLDQTIRLYLRLIEASEWAVDDPISSFLIYRSLLDAYPHILGDLLDSNQFYLRHQDDKGDHILVNDRLDIVGIIDWEWSKVVAKLFAFSAPVMLLPDAFLEGSNELSQEEEDFATIFEYLQRSDMAGYIRNGRVCHRITFILDTGDRIDDCKPHLKGLYEFLGEVNWEWEAWRSGALERYHGDPILQLLMARV